MNPDPITASRERIVAEYDEQWPQELEPVYIPEIRNFINAALLQHEAVVREEIARKIQLIESQIDPDRAGAVPAKQALKEAAAQAIRTTQPTI